MKLKSNILATALLAALSGMTLSAQAANPYVDLTLEGIVTKSTCEMTANNGSDTVNVGALKTSDFTEIGKATGTGKTFDVTLAKCADAETGELLISGTTNTTYPTVFTGTNTEEVGFIIQDAKNNAMGNKTSTDDTKAITVEKDGSLKYTFTAFMASVVPVADLGASMPTAPVTVVYYVK